MIWRRDREEYVTGVRKGAEVDGKQQIWGRARGGKGTCMRKGYRRGEETGGIKVQWKRKRDKYEKMDKGELKGGNI